MSPRSWVVRVQDMIKAIDEASAVLHHKSLEDFKIDRTAVLATVACIQILGEASKHVPDEVKKKYPEIPWSEIRGMRNKIAHEYFDVDESIVWITCKEDLPKLRPLLIKILDLTAA